MVHQLVNNFIIHLVLSRFGPYLCQPVIAGLGEDDKPFICTMDSIGAKYVEFLSTFSNLETYVLCQGPHGIACLFATYQMLCVSCRELAKDFVVSGTASESLYGACEAMYKPDMVCTVLALFFAI